MVAGDCCLPGPPAEDYVCIFGEVNKLLRSKLESDLCRNPFAANWLPFKPSQLLRDDNLDIRNATLHGPILLTKLRLAWPTILVLVAQVAVGVAEIFYVSFLGTTALSWRCSCLSTRHVDDH